MRVRLHKEGFATILIVTILLLLTLIWAVDSASWYAIIGLLLMSVIFLLILYFFRAPIRIPLNISDDKILAPADGKVVVIEEVDEKEFLQQRCLQISIFMSPLNVHINWNPISGKVVYHKHHPGKYLVAWHPKSSTDNERTTLVYALDIGTHILVRQIAGAMARRIVNYLKEGDQVIQGEEMGFIKFGSRVDVLLPIEAQVEVMLQQKVKGNQTILATLPKHT